MDLILTGQVKGIYLLMIAGLLFAYFLPSVLSFMRAQKRFWIVFPLKDVKPIEERQTTSIISGA